MDAKGPIENMNIVNTLKANSMSHTWTSARRQSSSRPWKWDDGTEVGSFSNWHATHPTSSHLCFYISSGSGVWYGRTCSSGASSIGALCQRTFKGMDTNKRMV